MEVIFLNIPEAFRTTHNIRRADYQPIDDQPVTKACTIGCTAVTVLCVADAILGLILLSQGYVITAFLSVIPIPWTIFLYEKLKDLDWGRCWGCLRRICCCCCCRTADLPTAELPGPQQFPDPHNPQQHLPDSPIPQHGFPNPPTLYQAFPEPPSLQQAFPNHPTTQQVFTDTEDTRQTFSPLKQPAPEPQTINDPVSDVSTMQLTEPSTDALVTESQTMKVRASDAPTLPQESPNLEQVPKPEIMEDASLNAPTMQEPFGADEPAPEVLVADEPAPEVLVADEPAPEVLVADEPTPVCHSMDETAKGQSTDVPDFSTG